VVGVTGDHVPRAGHVDEPRVWDERPREMDSHSYPADFSMGLSGYPLSAPLQPTPLLPPGNLPATFESQEIEGFPLQYRTPAVELGTVRFGKRKPEMKKQGYIEIDREFCKGCEICIAFCPESAIALTAELNAAGYLPATLAEKGKCTGCAVCAIVCPEVAIEVYRA